MIRIFYCEINKLRESSAQTSFTGFSLTLKFNNSSIRFKINATTKFLRTMVTGLCKIKRYSHGYFPLSLMLYFRVYWFVITPFGFGTLFTNILSAHLKVKTRQLRSELKSTKKDTRNIHEYITRIRTIASSLAAAGDNVIDNNLVDVVLDGLPKEYNPIVL